MSGVSHIVGDRMLLVDLELTVESGTSVAVTGPSGSGKSTVLMCALGLIRPDTGVVSVAGRDMVGLSAGQRARHRREHLGMVFQFGELLPELSPVENVALAGLLAGQGRRVAFERAEELLEELKVPVSRTVTGRLSGGERQRVAVARALVNQPAVLLADEPTGALDQRIRDQVCDILFDLPGTHGCALVVVTHDVEVASRADRRLELWNGVLREPREKGDTE
ncbi:ABC transporter ATP-binding protein [Streptomyces sp. ST2-7A]|uniref:ABC transporter ATP-binding protein n=1 Tax=Streptomyces sp. ST2-7A TaxID=2907214 RepID=UPI001F3D1EFC|nr:ATP-binding cassette domain-containing protein [Streptomyces sp. ST2-7A]MCE7081308.1 ATP-binding cassette domain-containing protein [Streptomyces sp. ST2-7A]